jgi:hypothetical protein
MPEIGIRTPKPVTRTVISASSWTGGSSLLEPMIRGVSKAEDEAVFELERSGLLRGERRGGVADYF